MLRSALSLRLEASQTKHIVMIEFECCFSDKMELEHRKKLREKEIRLQVQKVEKVKVLQEAFEDDLAYYKRTGKVKSTKNTTQFYRVQR